MKKSFKIATWNIGGAHTINSSATFDYDKEDLPYFVEMLQHLNLDVICLQESHTRDGGVVSKRLAEALGLPFIFDSPRSPSHIDKSYKLADAVISRYPIQNPLHIRLPCPTFELHFQDGTRARRFQTYLQTVRIQGITFANTHLQPLHLFGYAWGRDKGKKLAHDTENVFIDNLRTPLVFAGDFNAPNLEKDFPRLIESLQLEQALDNQATDVKGNKMDYILYSPDFVVKQAEVIKTDKSDHYLGWTELGLR